MKIVADGRTQPKNSTDKTADLIEKIQTRNFIGDPIWEFKLREEDKDGKPIFVTIDWGKVLHCDPEKSIEYICAFQRYFLEKRDVLQDADGLVTAKRYLILGFGTANAASLGAMISSRGYTCLEQMKAEDQLEYVLFNDHFKYAQGRTKEKQLSSAKSIIDKEKFLRNLYAFCNRNEIPGIVRPTQTLEGYFDKTRSILEAKGEDFADWRKPKKLDSISVSAALVALSEARKFLTSEKSKITLAVVSAIQDLEKRPNSNHFSRIRDGVLKPRKTKSGKLLGVDGSELFNNIRGNLIQEFSVENISDLDFDQIPFKNICDINSHARLMYGASIVVFFCLSGIRISEVSSIKMDDFIVDHNGSVWYYSANRKTNNGIFTKRPITGYILETYDVIKKLSARPKKMLFEYTYVSRVDSVRQNLEKVRVANYAQQGRISSYIRKKGVLGAFFISLGEAIDEDIRDELVASTPHAWRHVFHEFALRRFEGPVREALRDHSRHSYNSFMQMHYQGDKIFEEVDQKALSDSYIADMVGRQWESMQRGERELYGPIGKWIAGVLSTYKAVSLEDLDDPTDEILDDLSGVIEAHEYGFCVLRISTEMQAQCYDSKSKAAKTKDACWDLCGKCVHRLTTKSQEESIIRIGFSAQEAINSLIAAKVPSLTSSHKRTLATCEMALREMQSEKLEND